MKYSKGMNQEAQASTVYFNKFDKLRSNIEDKLQVKDHEERILWIDDDPETSWGLSRNIKETIENTYDLEDLNIVYSRHDEAISMIREGLYSVIILDDGSDKKGPDETTEGHNTLKKIVDMDIGIPIIYTMYYMRCLPQYIRDNTSHVVARQAIHSHMGSVIKRYMEEK